MKKIIFSKKINSALLINFFLLVMIFGFQSPLIADNQKTNPDSNLISAYIPYDPIRISNDGNFTDYGFDGSGTEIDPYLIENLEIITEEIFAIRISDVTEHFVIQHCYLESDSYGIDIENAAQGTVTVFNNTCVNNFQYGIRIEEAEGTIVMNNTVDNSHRGIYAYHSEFSLIENNTIIDCNYGLDIVYTDPITIKNNFLYNCGIYISDLEAGYPFYTLENNYVNDKIVGYFVNIHDVIFEDPIYGQLIFISCSDITIKNQVLNNANFGLIVRYCENIRIINNTFKNNTNGIFLYQTLSAEIINNTIEDGGMWVQSSDNALIQNNYFYDNYYAINLDHSDFPIIESNLYVDNTRGIFLQYSDNALIQNNTCRKNEYIINSYGIYLHGSNNAVIKLNTIENAIRYGLYFVSSSENNLVFLNSFINNNPSGFSQASDDGISNFWYSPSLNVGNYWDDLLGSENYTIDGTSDSVDLFPIVEKDVPPVIDHPDNVEYEENSVGNTISWVIYDLDPNTYIIYLDGTEVEQDSWVFLNILTINIDFLSVGTYNYTIVLFDTNGNFTTDTVIVNVIPIIDEFGLFYALVPSYILLIAFVLLPLLRKKKNRM